MMTKLEEVRAVYAAREGCIKNGSHVCGGNCYAFRAPRYSYNGGPYTPERKLREEALGGDEEALDALLALAEEAAVAAAAAADAFRAAMEGLEAAGEGHVLIKHDDGPYEVVEEEDDYGAGVAIVTHYGSDFHRDWMTVI